jgi:hypothetical protein
MNQKRYNPKGGTVYYAEHKIKGNQGLITGNPVIYILRPVAAHENAQKTPTTFCHGRRYPLNNLN